eukprot:gene22159-28266_t
MDASHLIPESNFDKVARELSLVFHPHVDVGVAESDSHFSRPTHNEFGRNLYTGLSALLTYTEGYDAFCVSLAQENGSNLVSRLLVDVLINPASLIVSPSSPDGLSLNVLANTALNTGGSADINAKPDITATAKFRVSTVNAILCGGLCEFEYDGMLIAQFVSTLKTAVEQQGDKSKSSKALKSTTKGGSGGKDSKKPLHLMRKVDVFVNNSEVSEKVQSTFPAQSPTTVSSALSAKNNHDAAGEVTEFSTPLNGSDLSAHHPLLSLLSAEELQVIVRRAEQSLPTVIQVAGSHSDSSEGGSADMLFRANPTFESDSSLVPLGLQWRVLRCPVKPSPSRLPCVLIALCLSATIAQYRKASDTSQSTGCLACRISSCQRNCAQQVAVDGVISAAESILLECEAAATEPVDAQTVMRHFVLWVARVHQICSGDSTQPSVNQPEAGGGGEKQKSRTPSSNSASDNSNSLPRSIQGGDNAVVSSLSTSSRSQPSTSSHQQQAQTINLQDTQYDVASFMKVFGDCFIDLHDALPPPAKHSKSKTARATGVVAEGGEQLSVSSENPTSESDCWSMTSAEHSPENNDGTLAPPAPPRSHRPVESRTFLSVALDGSSTSLASSQRFLQSGQDLFSEIDRERRSETAIQTVRRTVNQFFRAVGKSKLQLLDGEAAVESFATAAAGVDQVL